MTSKWQKSLPKYTTAGKTERCLHNSEQAIAYTCPTIKIGSTLQRVQLVPVAEKKKKQYHTGFGALQQSGREKKSSENLT